MTKYIKLSGVWKSSIQVYPNPAIGFTWLREGYVNISGTWRTWFPNGTWSSSANLPDGIRQGGSSNSESGFSATIFGGQNSFSPILSLTYEFNGTSWSSGGSMTYLRQDNGGTGTAAAPLAYWGDNSPTTTEEYNASTNVWATGGTITTGIVRLGSGAGTQTSALSAGGLLYGINSYLDTTLSYNGTSWAVESGTLNFAGSNRSLCGTQTSAVATCWSLGDFSSSLGRRVTETWNGTSWTSQEAFGIFYNNSLSRCSNAFAVSCTGTQTAAMLSGNATLFSLSYSEEFDGSLWALAGSLLTPRYSHYSSGGLGNNSLVTGGEGSSVSYLTSTERYTRIV